MLCIQCLREEAIRLAAASLPPDVNPLNLNMAKYIINGESLCNQHVAQVVSRTGSLVRLP